MRVLRQVTVLLGALGIALVAWAGPVSADSSTSEVFDGPTTLGAITSCSAVQTITQAHAATAQSGQVNFSITNLGQVVLSGSGAIGWNASSGPFTLTLGFPAQPPGSLLGAYFAVGVPPINAPQDQEVFVLYRCGPAGTSQLLFACQGPLHSCPQSAAEALSVRDLEVDPSHPKPGEEIEASATGCYGLPAWVQLRNDDELDEDDNLKVAPDGDFSGDLTVPSDVAPGTELEVVAGCGDPDDPIADQDSEDITVAFPTPTAQPAGAVTVEPKFTG